MARKEQIPPNNVAYIREIKLYGPGERKVIYWMRIRVISPNRDGSVHVEIRGLQLVHADQLPFYINNGIEVYPHSKSEDG